MLEYSWKVHKFNHVPPGFWENLDNVRATLKDVSEELGIKSLDDWYAYSGMRKFNEKSPISAAKELDRVGLSGLLVTHNGLINLLMKCYPEVNELPYVILTSQHNWSPELLKKNRAFPSKIQNFLFKELHDLFPNALDIQQDYLHPDIKYGNHGNLQNGLTHRIQQKCATRRFHSFSEARL